MKSIKPTPAIIANRSALPAVRVRTGTYNSFLASLHRGLADSNRPGFSGLTLREGDDFTLGLLDAWAATLDNLSFYAERQANESYLRTVQRRPALRSAVRLIGYELAPAKAAACHLVFEVEAHNTGEQTLLYPTGLAVRSIPHDGELPQLFETIEPLAARADWNAMRPLSAWPQELDKDSGEISLAGKDQHLATGDPVLLMQGGVPLATDNGGGKTYLRRVTGLRSGIGNRQIASLQAEPSSPPVYAYLSSAPLLYVWPDAEQVSSVTLAKNLGGKRWTVSALASTSWFGGISVLQMQKAIRALDFAPDDAVLPHVLRVRAGFFGAAASTALLPATSRISSPADITATDSESSALAAQGRARLYLDREVSGIASGGGVLIRDGAKEAWVRLLGVETTGVEAYGQSARVTRLDVEAEGFAPDGSKVALSGFLIRNSSLFAMPEELRLSDLPITDPVGAGVGEIGPHQVELEHADLLLEPGRTMVISGERADLTGVMASEIRVLAKNEIVRGHSLLSFTAPLAYQYVRSTVQIYANVAEATHGESVTELLGDGDATKSFQSFKLHSAPLTHVSARNQHGMAPAIEIRVNRVRWHLVEDFRDCGPEDRVYLLRHEEDGSTHVLFGDGVQGARLPTGTDNVEAIYRKGAGRDGHLEAGQLSLLAAKPASLKSVYNPLPPAGGRDAENLENARRNAPLGVLTLGRVVTLRDYANFARGFAGIAKARVDWAFDGFSRPILVTVAGEGGILLPETGDDLENLRAALQQAGEADVAVEVRNYRPLGFGLSARLFVSVDYQPEGVENAARTALLSAFSFDSRELGESVSQAQVIAVLQAVPGVTGVALDALYTGETVGLSPRLRAAVGRPDVAGRHPVVAELLTIDPVRLQLETGQ